ncbi:hypothetical protein J7M00_02360 [bacterium]|nr:hypothetical protein [bacterium]
MVLVVMFLRTFFYLKKNDDLGQSNSTGTIIWTPEKNIRSGIYFVRVKSEDGLNFTKRIVYLK